MIVPGDPARPNKRNNTNPNERTDRERLAPDRLPEHGTVPALEGVVRRPADQLDRFCDHVMGCRVVIDIPHKHHHHGNQYHVRLNLTVRGEELVVNREPAGHSAAHDLEAAVGEAFDTVGRLLEEYFRRRRKDVMVHAGPPHAKVRLVLPGQDHEFLETADGREVYFHRHSLVGPTSNAWCRGPR